MVGELWAQLIAWFDVVFIEQFNFWILFGFVGQAMFTMRFVVQWVMSERARRSIIPLAFWFFSIAGGMLLFIYAIHRKDPVFIAGQSAGLFVYIRNLMLIWREQRLVVASG